MLEQNDEGYPGPTNKPSARDLLTLELDVRREMMRAAGQMEVRDGE